ncbi:hypothetical protein [Penaeicola halotolerans]|uniref:hypothetical protein n=1 Tax=Penaeicola halotolerans TaxID=2793196 RepID=UPI001CF8DF1C|nr:hypothetical protein [Penaeicola halotolerans]
MKCHFYKLLTAIIILSACEAKTPEETVEDLSTNSAINLRVMPEWEGFWNQQLGEFSIDQFELIRTDSLDILEWPHYPAKEEMLASTFVYSPDSSRYIDFLSYRYAQEVENGQPAFLTTQPDAEVALVDLASNMRQRLLFMGPSGAFETVTWLSNDTFLVGGYFEHEEGFTPIIYHIDLQKQEMQYYEYASAFEKPEQTFLTQKLKDFPIR